MINLRIKGCFFSVLLFYQPYVLKFEKFDKSFGVGEKKGKKLFLMDILFKKGREGA